MSSLISSWKALLIKFKHRVLLDRSIWKWCGIFAGIYVGSRLFFYRFYYPTLIRTFTPPSFFDLRHKSDTDDDDEAVNNNDVPAAHDRQRSAVSGLFPAALLRRLSLQPLHSQSLYSANMRWSQSNKASGKLMSLLHAILTVHKGLHILGALKLSHGALARGVDMHPSLSRDEQSSIMTLIDMNSAYVLTDLCAVYIAHPDALFIAHHCMVLFGGVFFKMMPDKQAAPIWIFMYSYADIPTIIFHSLWFLRNIGLNMEAMYNLFTRKSVKASSYLQGYQDIDQQLMAQRQSLSQMEKLLFLAFSASFLYVRVIVFSRVLPRWLWYSWKSPNYGNGMKWTATVCIGGLLSVGYVWSYQLVLKIKEVLSTVDSAALESNRRQQLGNLNQAATNPPQRSLMQGLYV